jgi:hypothetical protein
MSVAAVQYGRRHLTISEGPTMPIEKNTTVVGPATGQIVQESRQPEARIRQAASASLPCPRRRPISC